MSLSISKESIIKHDVAGPRYTSYPTAPEWNSHFAVDDYKTCLKAFGQTDKTLSLYIHVPFCEQLCYFCACNKVIRAQDPAVGDEFLKYLFKEIELISASIGRRPVVKQLHWGGGTPSYLSVEQSQRLMTKLHQHFVVDLDGEIAIEVDPRTVTDIKLTALRQLGFNRISLGVQDFDEKVQDDINRIQPFDYVKRIYDKARSLKFASINFDLIYGLPYQTRETFGKTVDMVIGLKPDRIALYSFAYVPWLSKPQNKFNLEAIPVQDEKLDIFLQSRQKLLDSGYLAIAMDHFALITDDMAKAFNEGTLHRNFMGYTLKPADEFIGLGPSAIGFLENSYIQNIKVLPEYYASLGKNEIPIERGKALSNDDQIRQWVINHLMCAFKIDKVAFNKRFNCSFDEYFINEGQHIRDCIEDGLIRLDGQTILVTDLGRIFVRNVCMGFDWYLRQKNGHKRFSRTV